MDSYNSFRMITCEQFPAKSLKINNRDSRIFAKFPFRSPFGRSCSWPSLWAHESRPAYLEIKETAPGQYSLLWRTPVLSGMRLPVVLQLPDDVRNLKEPTTSGTGRLPRRPALDRRRSKRSCRQAHRVSRSARHHHRRSRPRRNARRTEVDHHRPPLATLGRNHRRPDPIAR